MKKKMISVVSVLVLFQGANAQTWSPEKIISRAVQQSPQVRSSADQVAAREGALRQSRAFPNPEVGGIAGNRTGMLTVGQRIEYPTKRKVRIGQVEMKLEAARQRLAVTKQDVIYRTLTVFYRILAADRRAVLYRRNLAVSHQLLAAAQKKFDQGFGSRLDVIKAQVEVARARRLLLNVQKEELRRRNDLKLTLGLAASDTLILTDVLSDPLVPGSLDLDSLLHVARNHPRMRLAHCLLEEARLDVRAAKLAARPDFDFDIAGGIDDDESRIELELHLPLPLWDRKAGLKSEAYFMSESSYSDSADVWLEISRRVSASFYAYQNARQTMRLFEGSLVDQAEAAADMAQQAFETGPFRFLDLIDARRTYLETAMEVIEAQTSLRLAAIELMHASGTLYTGEQR